MTQKKNEKELMFGNEFSTIFDVCAEAHVNL